MTVQKTGVTLKSADRKGQIMTKTMIKKDFFAEGSFQFESQSADENPQLEFCLPFAELKHVVEGLNPDSSVL